MWHMLDRKSDARNPNSETYPNGRNPKFPHSVLILLGMAQASFVSDFVRGSRNTLLGPQTHQDNPVPWDARLKGIGAYPRVLLPPKIPDTLRALHSKFLPSGL